MNELGPEQKDTSKIEYEEIFVTTFEEAVNETIKADERDRDEDFRFVVMDIDGVLIDNTLVNLPILSHLVEPKITDSKRIAFKEISSVYEGRMALATNRDRNVRFFWNSDKFMAKVDNVVSSVENFIPVYEKMQKQFPSLAKERLTSLVEYICGSLVESGNYDSKREIVLTSIEDASIVSPNRATFLRALSKQLREELGMRVRIENYVIRG